MPTTTVLSAILAATLSLTCLSQAVAGGMTLGATRVIYPQGAKQVSLPLTNSDAKNIFLVQTWVATTDGQKSADFVVTPPLFVSQPKKENLLRIMYVGGMLPTDRETVYYLNSKSIPSVDKEKITGNTLQIATQSVIKVFIRPQNLPSLSTDAPGGLRCHYEGSNAVITNPSPYYVSLVQFFINNQRQPNNMVPPKGKLKVAASNGQGNITFQTVNDYGANTPTQICAR